MGGRLGDGEGDNGAGIGTGEEPHDVLHGAPIDIADVNGRGAPIVEVGVGLGDTGVVNVNRFNDSEE